MISKINQFINQNKLFTKENALLLAISGGVDSVVLLDVLAKLGYQVTLAHCNFNLRGSESDADEAFVKTLAEKYQLPIFVKHVDVASAKGSTQMAARELRYNWFNELLEQQDLDYIVTAHHLNDSIETVLLNLTKGTGISGLRGIQSKSGSVIRPLLEVTKNEILNYAKEQQLIFREDSSNKSDTYQRNKIRNQVIPILKEINPNFEGAVLQTLTNLRETEQVLEKSVTKKWGKLVEKSESNVIEISVAKLKKIKPISTYIYEFFKPFGFDNNQTQQIIDLLDAQAGKKIVSNMATIYKDRDCLLIEPLIKKSDPVFIINKDTTAANNLTFKKIEGIAVSETTTTASLDFDKLQFPIILRKWEQGDKFAPLGMGGKEKKLSDFFVDNKLSISNKKKAWILESNNQICWVVGMRISEKFKIVENTKNTYLVKLLL